MSSAGANAALRRLSEHNTLDEAITICDRLGLIVGASARKASKTTIANGAREASKTTIANGGRALLGLPNTILASVARNCGYSLEGGAFVESRLGDFEIDADSVSAIVNAADGDEDYALALLFRFSRESEPWYSYTYASASFINYNLSDERPVCDGSITQVMNKFPCTGAEAARVLSNANDHSIYYATNRLDHLIAKAKDPAALKVIKGNLAEATAFGPVANDVAASEPACLVPTIVEALYCFFDVNQDRRYLRCAKAETWSRATHAELDPRLQSMVVTVLLIAIRLASRPANGALAPLPSDVVEAILGCLHSYDYL